MLIQLALVVDSPAVGERLEGVLRQPDLLLSVLSGPSLAPRSRRLEGCDLVVASRSLLSEPLARTVATLRAQPERPELIVLTDREDPEDRARLLAAGAFAVVYQHLGDRQLRETLLALVRRRREIALGQFQAATTAGISLGDFASPSPAMTACVSLARRAAGSDSSVLILGETGVGKERLARAIHGEGRRSGFPFVAVNCAAVPDGLLESELFGHERGAFTGAERLRRGDFELAHCGTLFLDEIGEMPPRLQAKLLRAIQDREIRRLGSERPIPLDVRFMAATHRDLERDVAEGRFRADLYFRLAVVPLTVPPLRERPEDVPALVGRFLPELATLQRRAEVSGLTADAMSALKRYSWPGNVRELLNVLEWTVLVCRSERIGIADLPEMIVAAAPVGRRLLASHRREAVFERYFGQPLAAACRGLVEAFEREYLVRLLDECAGQLNEVASRAGIQPRTLYNKMRAHGLDKREFRRRKKPPRPVQRRRFLRSV